jgi:hypothetical protein
LFGAQTVVEQIRRIRLEGCTYTSAACKAVTKHQVYSRQDMFVLGMKQIQQHIYPVTALTSQTISVFLRLALRESLGAVFDSFLCGYNVQAQYLN